MGRAAKGSVDFHGSPPRWHARVTVPIEPSKIKPGGPKTKREWVDLGRPDLKNNEADKATAKNLARRHARLAKGATFVGKGSAADPATVTIAELADQWYELIDEDPDYKPATKYGQKSIFRTHILTGLGAQPVTMGTPVLRAFLRDKRTTLGGQTVRNVANTLTRFFADVKAEGWAPLAFNPMRDEAVRDMLPKLETPDPENIVHFARDVFEKLVNAPTTPADRVGLYVLDVLTGLRDGELHGLTFGDVAEEKGVPRLSITRQALFPREDTKVRIGTPKTKWGRRKIPLHPVAAAWLKAWKDDGWRAYVGREPTDADYLFPDPKGNVWRPEGADVLRADLGAAKLPTKFRLIDGSEVDFSFHSIRHTFATWLAAKDVDGDLVDRLLGQAPKSVRGRHYAAPSLEALARAIGALDLHVQGLTPPPAEARDDSRDDSKNSVPEIVPGSETSRNEAHDSSNSTMTNVAEKGDDLAENKADRDDAMVLATHLRKPQVVSSNLILGSIGHRKSKGFGEPDLER